MDDAFEYMRSSPKERHLNSFPSGAFLSDLISMKM